MNSVMEDSAKNLATFALNLWHLQFRRAYESGISRQEARRLAVLSMDKALSDSELIEVSGGIEAVIGKYLDLSEAHFFTCDTCAPKEIA
jgi:hypothetical protein